MSARWRASSRAIHTRTPRGGVVLDPVTKAYFTFNETGETLWKALEAGATLQELTAALCQEFAIDSDTAERDAGRWLLELEALQLIHVDDAPR